MKMKYMIATAAILAVSYLLLMAQVTTSAAVSYTHLTLPTIYSV